MDLQTDERWTAVTPFVQAWRVFDLSPSIYVESEGKQVVFRVPSGQKSGGHIFRSKHAAGLYLPSIPIPSRGSCHSRPTSMGLYLGCFLPEDTAPRQEDLTTLPMAVLFLFLLFLCGVPHVAAGKEQGVRDSARL